MPMYHIRKLLNGNGTSIHCDKPMGFEPAFAGSSKFNIDNPTTKPLRERQVSLLDVHFDDNLVNYIIYRPL